MKKLIPSFILYALSLLGFFLSDFIIISNYNDLQIAEWAFIKSYLFIGSIFFVRGADQLIVREPSSFDYVRNSRLKEAIPMLFIIFIISYFFTSNITDSLLYSFSVILFAAMTIFSARERAEGSYSKSQILSNFWKFIFFILVIFIEPKLSLPISLILISILSFKILSNNMKVKLNDAEIQNNQNRNLSKWFFLHNITVVSSLYLEQIILSKLAGPEFSAEIFKYNVIFTSVALSLNGFVGFVLLPKLRQFDLGSIHVLKKLWLILTLYVLIATVISISIGLAYSNFRFFEFDSAVLPLLFLLSFFRGVYLLPSAILGLRADSNQLKNSALFQIAVMILYVISMIILIHSDFFSVIFVYVLIVLHFAARFIISLIYSNKALRNA